AGQPHRGGGAGADALDPGRALRGRVSRQRQDRRLAGRPARPRPRPPRKPRRLLGQGDVMADPVLYETQDRVATLTLNRPERLNTIVPELIEAFVAARKRGNKDPED